MLWLLNFNVDYFVGLGPTVKEIDTTGLPVFPKMKFSMFQHDVCKYIKENCPGTHLMISVF